MTKESGSCAVTTICTDVDYWSEIGSNITSFSFNVGCSGISWCRNMLIKYIQQDDVRPGLAQFVKEPLATSTTSDAIFLYITFILKIFHIMQARRCSGQGECLLLDLLNRFQRLLVSFFFVFFPSCI